MSKTISNHPLVAEVESGDWGGDKKYFVHCIPGYWFERYETGSKSFDTVREFLDTPITTRRDT